MKAFLRKHWRMVLSLAGTAAGLIVVALPMTLGAYYEGKVERAIAAYRAAGEPIEAADFRKESVAEGENRAGALSRIAQGIPSEIDFSGPVTPWPERQVVGAAALAFAPDEAELEEALARPKVRWPTKLPGAFGGLEPHLNGLRQLANALAADGAIAATGGDPRRACVRLGQLLALGDSTEQDSSYIGWLVGLGIEALACEEVAREIRGATTEDLRPAIRYLSDEVGFRGRLTNAIRVDRAQTLATARLMAGTGMKSLFGSPLMNRTALSAMRLADLKLELMTEEDGSRRTQLQSAIAEIGSDKTQPLVGILVPSVSRSAELAIHDRTLRRASATLLACRAFEAGRGRLPASLAELVPEYLSVVPADPYAAGGEFLKYDAGRRVLYSVGPDGKDDGGDVRPPPSKDAEYAANPWDARDFGFELDTPRTVTSPRRR